MPHTIRLRGPWQYEALARTVLQKDGSTIAEPGELPPPGTIQMPADWSDTLGEDFRGRVRYTRRFGRPSGLEAEDRVSLVLSGIRGRATVCLGAQLLGELAWEQQTAAFEVTSLLLARNELIVEVELPRVADTQDTPESPAAQSGGLFGEVYLQITNRSEDNI